MNSIGRPACPPNAEPAWHRFSDRRPDGKHGETGGGKNGEFPPLEIVIPRTNDFADPIHRRSPGARPQVVYPAWRVGTGERPIHLDAGPNKEWPRAFHKPAQGNRDTSAAEGHPSNQHDSPETASHARSPPRRRPRVVPPQLGLGVIFSVEPGATLVPRLPQAGLWPGRWPFRAPDPRAKSPEGTKGDPSARATRSDVARGAKGGRRPACRQHAEPAWHRFSDR